MFAERVWRTPGDNGTAWPSVSTATDTAGDSSNSAEDDVKSQRWQDSGNGVIVASKCFGVPGVVNIEMLQLLQEHADDMSSTCRRQIFTSPVVEAALELLWDRHAYKCWLRELLLYLCFLATLVAFSLIVNSTFHDDHDEGSSIAFRIAYLVVTLATGAFGCYLGKVEHGDFRMILERAQKNGTENVTTWGFVSDKMGMSNVVDILVAALAVMCSASALVFTPGPFLISILSVQVFLSVVNL